MPHDLKGKIAIVTGGSRGLGRYISLDLASKGVYVIVNYRKNDKAAEETTNLIREKGGEAKKIQCDILNVEETRRMFRSIKEEKGKIDILVNNAGIYRDNLFIMMQDEEWDKVIKTNLYGMYNCCKAVIKLMLAERSGSIVNIASIAGLAPSPGQANYSAAKGGIIAFTRTLAKEVAAKGIRVNCIAPGLFDTDMTKRLPRHIREMALKNISLERFGRPEELAKLVSFLASDDASYLVGQTIIIDGGIIM